MRSTLLVPTRTKFYHLFAILLIRNQSTKLPYSLSFGLLLAGRVHSPLNGTSICVFASACLYIISNQLIRSAKFDDTADGSHVHFLLVFPCGLKCKLYRTLTFSLFLVVTRLDQTPESPTRDHSSFDGSS